MKIKLSYLTILMSLIFFVNAARATEFEQAQQWQKMQQQGSADNRFAQYFDKLQQSPKDPALHVAIAKLYFEKELWELARISYLRALSFQADYWEAHLGMAQLYRKKNLKKEALLELEKASAAAPDNLELQYQRGVWYMEPETFDYKKAKKQYEALKQLNSPWAEKLGTLMQIKAS